MAPGFPICHKPSPHEGFDVRPQGALSIDLPNSLSILTHSLNKYLLSTHSIQDIVLGTGDPAKHKNKKTDHGPALVKLTCQWREQTDPRGGDNFLSCGVYFPLLASRDMAEIQSGAHRFHGKWVILK